MLLIKNAIIYGESKDILIDGQSIIGIGYYDYSKLKESFNDSIEIQVIEANKNVIPAYIDNHVHIVGGGGEDGFSSRISDINVDNIVSCGVGTVVGVLGTDTITKSVKNLVAKTKELNERGITAYCLTGGYEVPSPTLTGKIIDDIAYINEIVGTKTAISDHRCYNPTKEELIRMISETRVAALVGKKPGIVNIHLGYGKGNMDILFDIINETNIPITNLLPTHITKTPDLIDQGIRWNKLGGYCDITVDQDLGDVIEKIDYMAKRCDSSRITFSSDSNGSCPIWVDGECKGIRASTMMGLHEVVRKLVLEYNYSLREATSFLTTNPAKVYKLYRKGEIAVGKDADLLILDDDYNIETVAIKGKVLQRKRMG